MRKLQPVDSQTSADRTASRRTGGMPAWLGNALDWMTIAVIMLGVLELSARLALRNSPVPSPAEVVSAERYRLRFLDLMDMVSQAVLWSSGVNQRRMEALTAALLDAIADESVAAGAATTFVYLPHSDEVTDPSLTLDAERFFADYCSDREVSCLDLRPAFLDRIRAGVAIKAPGHWHGTGHALVAEELSRYLVESGLVPS